MARPNLPPCPGFHASPSHQSPNPVPQRPHLEVGAHFGAGLTHLVHRDGAAAVLVDGLEQLGEACDLGLCEAAGSHQQGRLFELVHGRKLGHAREHHIV